MSVPATPAPALKPLQGAPLAMLTVAVAFATFMEILDLSIANVAVPNIAGNLGVSSSQGTWVISSYSVASAIMVPLTGWISKRFGEVRGQAKCRRVDHLAERLSKLHLALVQETNVAIAPRQ